MENIWISDISEMFPFGFFACLRLMLTSEAVRRKFVLVAIFSIAILLVVAIIACTTAKAFKEDTWMAFAILLVVSIQVRSIRLCKWF